MESLGRMAAIILAVIFTVLFPIRYDACKTCLSEDSYINVCLDHFYYEVAEQKVLTKQHYDDFLYQISAGGDSFDVSIDCYHKRMDEESEYLMYEDVQYECCKKGIFNMKKGDYICIQLVRKNVPIVQKLMNSWFPTFYKKNTYITGGYVI